MHTNTLIYLQYIRDIISAMPGTREGICYGTEGFYVQKKLLARMKEDGETLVIHTKTRETWMDIDPETFFITDHYLNSDYILVTLARVQPEDLKKLLGDAWLARAPKTLLKQYLG
ncbi:MmcQ/YjbR family DNA-binding protein [Mucilaginibacter paludis]|uniref:MmcQ/YjbR family DNA-binding protein n=1 Tax=Mucilaginibacter paludis DSM 18603 TaxID=714943 RepID=H1YIR6_9SPHI|nr:hypothetical protein [Mucilaginibacter paludis]EHQ27611.1 hypothetical protein Mucpa_3513 [Mucilaginibacter paludis DSM 18603]